VKCNNTHFCKSRDGDEITIQVELLLRFWRESLYKPKVAVLHFLPSHTPNEPESIAAYDREMASLLQNLIQSRNMNVIFATDHGRVDDEHSFSFPMMSAVVCEQALNEERKQNMAFNSQRMVAMYDIHHTLRHLLLGDPDVELRDGVQQEFVRSMLASKIARNRTCMAAGVPPSVCPCLARSWKPVPQKLEATIRAELEKELRYKQQPSCPAFDIQNMIILSPESPKKGSKLFFGAKNFIRGEIHVQEGVVFSVKGYMVGPSLLLHSLVQSTSYRKFEACTPKGSNPQFCICTPAGAA